MFSNSGNYRPGDRSTDGRHNHKSKWGRDRDIRQTPPLNLVDRMHAGFNPAPQGTRKRFVSDEPDDRFLNKRERSRERSSYERELHDEPQSHLQGDHSSRDRPSARNRYGSEQPSSKRPRLEESSRPPLHSVSESDELDVLPHTGSRKSPAPKKHNSRPTKMGGSSSPKVKAEPESGPPSGIFGLGRATISVFKSLVSGGSQSSLLEPDAVSALQDALEESAQLQSELRHLQEKHEELGAKYRLQEEQLHVLRTAGQKSEEELQNLKMATHASQTERADLMRRCSAHSVEVEQARARVDQLSREKEELRERARVYEDGVDDLVFQNGNLSAQLHSMQSSVDKIDQLTREKEGLAATLRRYEARVKDLVIERGNLGAQVKQLKAAAISVDPFDNKVDQVSEASVKSGVDSLNDSLDAFTMTLLDEAEELATMHSDMRVPFAVPEYDLSRRLVAALAEHSESVEDRGFLLDALLHESILLQLHRWFFSGMVVPQIWDKRLIIDELLNDLTQRESWTVAQRWRSLAAVSGDAILAGTPSERQAAAIADLAGDIIVLLHWAYRLPLGTFEPLKSKIQDRLQSLHDEAQKISIVVRRDILTVRMSFVCPEPEGPYPLYDPESMSAVWPDMGVVTGDSVIGLYHLGLKKETENGLVSYLIKPEVTTAALLRHLAKTMPV